MLSVSMGTGMSEKLPIPSGAYPWCHSAMRSPLGLLALISLKNSLLGPGFHTYNVASTLDFFTESISNWSMERSLRQVSHRYRPVNKAVRHAAKVFSHPNSDMEHTQKINCYPRIQRMSASIQTNPALTTERQELFGEFAHASTIAHSADGNHANSRYGVARNA